MASPKRMTRDHFLAFGDDGTGGFPSSTITHMRHTRVVLMSRKDRPSEGVRWHNLTSQRESIAKRKWTRVASYWRLLAARTKSQNQRIRMDGLWEAGNWISTSIGRWMFARRVSKVRRTSGGRSKAVQSRT